ncbi:hypothetical protein J7F03_32965, partial [Streptomyces sp. ISL-43]|uniref:hypothetical protein n=1 Tax=Streptomyces sp. ISL-43 TaxID=2819183 RepID=UPI001BEC453F
HHGRTATSQVFFKGTSSTEMDGVSTFGVDFWHAVEFSRNGRFLCTHPLGLSSGRFLRFQLYQIISAVCFSKVAVDLDLNLVTVGVFAFRRSTTLALIPCGS